MPLKDVLKISRKTFFNPIGWFGYSFFKSQSQLIIGILKDTFSPATPKRKETFDQAVERLKLSEQDLKQSEQNYLLSAVVFMLCGVGTLGFSVYLFLKIGTFAGGVLGLLTTTLFFTYAFRSHFLYFQIKHRKLGCTLEEWRQGKIYRHEETKP